MKTFSWPFYPKKKALADWFRSKHLYVKRPSQSLDLNPNTYIIIFTRLMHSFQKAEILVCTWGFLLFLFDTSVTSSLGRTWMKGVDASEGNWDAVKGIGMLSMMLSSGLCGGQAICCCWNLFIFLTIVPVSWLRLDLWPLVLVQSQKRTTERNADDYKASVLTSLFILC